MTKYDDNVEIVSRYTLGAHAPTNRHTPAGFITWLNRKYGSPDPLFPYNDEGLEKAIAYLQGCGYDVTVQSLD